VKVIFYVLECMDYEFLQECNTPTIDSLNPHPAYSYGCTTVASVPALLTGYTPICKIAPSCPHNTIPKKYLKRSPFFINNFKEKYLYIPNGWVWWLLKPYLSNLMPKLKKWHERFNTREMIEDFKRRPKGENYLAYFHVMETHPPFLEGLKQVKSGSPEWLERRIKALELADRNLKLLLEEDYDLLIVTADHNLWHDITHPKGFEVFIAIDSRLPP